jgi:hypothetical protein
MAANAGASKKKNKHKDEIHYSGPVEFSADDIFFDLQDVVEPSEELLIGDDFKLKGQCRNGEAKVKGKGPYDPQIAAFFDGTETYAHELHAGETIGPQNFFHSALLQDYGVIIGAAEWHVGDRGFLGLRITIGCDDYYGWADVTLNTLNCDDGPIFTLHSYAINKEPFESIAAGEKKEKKTHLHLPASHCSATPTATPTPVQSANGAIALLIAGAAGVETLKKRRTR